MNKRKFQLSLCILDKCARECARVLKLRMIQLHGNILQTIAKVNQYAMHGIHMKSRLCATNIILQLFFFLFFFLSIVSCSFHFTYIEFVYDSMKQLYLLQQPN